MINIKSFGKKRTSGDSSTSTSNTSTSSTGYATTVNTVTELETHLIFGQPFNGTQDVEGELNNVTNINATGDITCNDINAENATINHNITADTMTSEVVSTVTVNSDNANINSVNVTNDLTSPEAVINYLESLNIKTDYLTVQKSAHFWELVIDKIKSTSGNLIITPANATVEKVVNNTNNYRLCWRCKDENGKGCANEFVVGDQVICNTFNATEGTSYNVSNKYYWALVTATGIETYYDTISGENQQYNYIEISKTDKDGNSTPDVGDEIAMLGNRTVADRQNAIIISSYNASYLDSAIQAPSIVQYSGINDYHLSTHRVNVISANNNTFYGDFRVINQGQDQSLIDIINGKSTAIIMTDSDAVFALTDSNGYIHSVNDVNGLPKKVEVYVDGARVPTSAWANALVPSWGSLGTLLTNTTINTYDVTYTWSTNFPSQLLVDNQPIALEFPFSFVYDGNTYHPYKQLPVNCIKQGQDVVGADAEFDRIVVNEAKAIVTLEDKLALSFNAYVQHVKGNSITTVTNLTDYTMRAIGDNNTYIQLNKSTYFYYVNPQYIEGYSSSQNRPLSFTLTLYKNGSTIDTYTVPVVFDAGSIFDVKDDAIQAAVAQSYAYTDGQTSTLENGLTRLQITADGLTSTVTRQQTEIDNNTNNINNARTDISQINQTYNSINSRVTTIEGDYITSSMIEQTSRDIKLEVYNEINKKTGINIFDGTINLNADTTNIYGKLNLYDDDDGIVLYDENGNPKISIEPDEIGLLQDYNFGVSKRFTTSKNVTVTQSSNTLQLTFNDVNIGHYDSGQQMKIYNIQVDGYFTSTFDTVFSNVAYQMTVSNTNTTLVTRSGNCTEDGIYRRIPEYINTNVPNGDYKVSVTVTFTFAQSTTTRTGTFSGGLILYTKTTPSQVSKIATDGAVFATNDEKYNWFGSDYTQIRNGDVAMRVMDGYIQRSVTNTKAPVVGNNWGDISSTVPYCIVNDVTYTATVNDCFIVFSSAIGHSDSERRYLYLPLASTCAGKVIYVKNAVGDNTRVMQINEAEVLMNCYNSNEATFQPVGNDSYMFVSYGYGWVTFNCG